MSINLYKETSGKWSPYTIVRSTDSKKEECQQIEWDKNYRTAIVLQGGGALGAFELGVLKALYDERGEGFKPSVVTGVSIGAINAAVLAANIKDPIPALEKLWSKLRPWPPSLSSWPPYRYFDKLWPDELAPAWSVSGMYFANPLSYPWWYAYQYMTPHGLKLRTPTNFSDTSPLRETLRELVHIDGLNGSDAPRVAVGAVDVQTKIDIFATITRRRNSTTSTLLPAVACRRSSP